MSSIEIVSLQHDYTSPGEQCSILLHSRGSVTSEHFKHFRPANKKITFFMSVIQLHGKLTVNRIIYARCHWLFIQAITSSVIQMTIPIYNLLLTGNTVPTKQTKRTVRDGKVTWQPRENDIRSISKKPNKEGRNSTVTCSVWHFRM